MMMNMNKAKKNKQTSTFKQIKKEQNFTHIGQETNEGKKRK